MKLSVLCARSRYVAVSDGSTVFGGGPRTLGHITCYRVLTHSSMALSSFQTARPRDAAEIPEPTLQIRAALALARRVNSSFARRSEPGTADTIGCDRA